jgi:hypothetical protein
LGGLCDRCGEEERKGFSRYEETGSRQKKKKKEEELLLINNKLLLVL